jgi:hypothetical protein
MKVLTTVEIEGVSGGLSTGDVAGSALGAIAGTAAGAILVLVGAPAIATTAIGLAFGFATSFAWAAATEQPSIAPATDKTPSVEVHIIDPISAIEAILNKQLDELLKGSNYDLSY